MAAGCFVLEITDGPSWALKTFPVPDLPMWIQSLAHSPLSALLSVWVPPVCVGPSRLCGSLPGGPSGKEPACQCGRRKKCGSDPWVGKIPWRRARLPSPVFLPGESHGQRSLASYSPWGRRESELLSNGSCTHTHDVKFKMNVLLRVCE